MILYPALLSVNFIEEKYFKTKFIFINPSTIFFLIWILKNYMTTGCFIFPVSLHINNFDWYIPESTKIMKVFQLQIILFRLFI